MDTLEKKNTSSQVRAAARRLAVISLIDAIGTGLFLSGSVLYLSRTVGLSPNEIAVGLVAAGLTGLLTSYPVSALGDRFGSRKILTVTQFWRFGGFLAYAFVDSFANYLVVVVLVAVADRVSNPLLQATVGNTVPAVSRVVAMGWVRAARNAGYAVGSLLASGAVAIGTEWSFRAIILADAGSFLVAGVLLMLTREPSARPSTGRGRERPSKAAPLRDWRYVKLTVLNGVVSIHFVLLSVGMPLWLSLRTDIPDFLLPVLFTVNTVLAIMLQPAVAKRSKSMDRSKLFLLLAGFCLAFSCLCYGLAGSTHRLSAIFLAFAGVVLLTAGELFQSAGSWTLSYGLAPAGLRSAYLGLFGIGVIGIEMVAPAIFSSAILTFGLLAWVALAVIISVAGIAIFLGKWGTATDSTIRFDPKGTIRYDQQGGRRH